MSHARPGSFRALIAFLDDVTRAEGHAYKDVVHPFAVSAWLPESGLRVLRIKRQVEDVAFAMIRLERWSYPACAAPPADVGGCAEFDVRVVDGLLCAELALVSLPGAVVDYEALIEDEGVLHAALLRLYPSAQVPEIRYIDEEFRQRRDAIVARRNEDDYHAFVSLVSRRRAVLALPARASCPGAAASLLV